MNDQTNGIMAFILHVTPPASFNHHQTRFPTVRGTWFDVDLETLRDGTAEVTLVGVDERTLPAPRADSGLWQRAARRRGVDARVCDAAPRRA